MNHAIRPLTMLAALLLTTALGCAQSAVTIQQQWQIGKRYTQHMRMEQSTEMSLGGQTQRQQMSVTSELTVAVTKHADPKYKRLTLRYSRMTMDMEMAGQKMSIDTAKPDTTADNPLASPLTAIVDKEFKVVTDNTNKITTFENFDELASNATNPMAAGFMSKDAISQAVRQGGLLALPDKPVKPGDTWPFNLEIPLAQMGRVVMKGTYTFQKSAPRDGVPCLEISFTGELKVADDKNSVPDQGGMKIQGATLKGTVWFDNALGAARASEFDQEMIMLVKSPVGAGDSIKVPTHQKISTTLVRVEALP